MKLFVNDVRMGKLPFHCTRTGPLVVGNILQQLRPHVDGRLARKHDIDLLGGVVQGVIINIADHNQSVNGFLNP